MHHMAEFIKQPLFALRYFFPTGALKSDKNLTETINIIVAVHIRGKHRNSLINCATG